MWFREKLKKIQNRNKTDTYINSDNYSYSSCTITFIYALYIQRKKAKGNKTKN